MKISAKNINLTLLSLKIASLHEGKEFYVDTKVADQKSA